MSDPSTAIASGQAEIIASRKRMSAWARDTVACILSR